MKILVPILVLLIVFFAFPLMNGTAAPDSVDPQVLGDFVRASLQYWQDLFNNVLG